ncbi:MAG: amino acid adenylation domain-containing protein [Acidobacteriota bacterium]|nr:amino acid adenylation domain-containing protein [Acidobacteriota bacterium]
MTRVEDFMAELIEAGIHVRLENGDLRVRAPKGALTAELKDRLRAGKADIIALLNSLTAEKEQAAAPILPVPRIPTPPLSYAQQRLWLLEQFETTGAQYHMPMALHFEGVLSADILARSLCAILDRHEALRSRFPTENGVPVLEIFTADAPPFEIVDLTGRESNRVRSIARNFALQPFDLARGPLYRFQLLKRAGNDHILVGCFHHIVIDAWSMEIFARELTTYYRFFLNHGPQPNPLPIQYPDFAAWQQQPAQVKQVETQMDWWRKQLAGDLPVLDLPTDHEPKNQIAAMGARHALLLDQRQTETLQQFANQHNATPFMVLLSAWYTLLFRYSNQSDLLVGSPIAGRNRMELESLIGFFVNMLVLRCDMSGAPGFRTLLQRVRNLTVDAFAHQEVPFEKLVEELQPERGVNHTPFFRTVFGFQDAVAEKSLFQGQPGLPSCRPYSLGMESAKFELLLTVVNHRDRMELLFQYNELLFETETIERLGDHFVNLLKAAIDKPDAAVAQLPMMDEPARRTLLSLCHADRHAPRQTSFVPAQFVAAATRFPEREALRFQGESMNYAALRRAVSNFAHLLTARGVTPGKRLGIHLERGFDLVIAILATIDRGATYVPIDPAAPLDRKRTILGDADVHLVITDSPLLAEERGSIETEILVTGGNIPDAGAYNLPEVPITGHSPAYIIYTSGSTGKPKGSVVTHGNLARLFDATRDVFHFDENDRWTLFHSYAFDFSVWEIWGALLHGGCLVIVPSDISRNAEAFYQLLVTEQVTVLNQTPSAFRALITAEAQLEKADWQSGRWIIFGGEALEPAHLAPWYQTHDADRPQLVNMFGITETTVHVTWRAMSPADLTSSASMIGKPIADLELYVLDPQLNLCPPNIKGELCVGGAGVTREYLGHPALTAQRFVPNPFSQTTGARLYRSGDLGRLQPNGDFAYLGRMDRQVKLRGFRIEVGEIEAALMRRPHVSQAVVRLRYDSRENPQLLAWVVTTLGHATDELRHDLKKDLPDYMIPTAIIPVDALPLTLNGKLDERALPMPDGQAAANRVYTPPRNRIEEDLIEIWEAVLNSKGIGVTDNFFEIGGHSLLATQVMTRIRQRFDRKLPLETMFASPTIAELAAYLQAEIGAEKEDQLITPGLKEWWQARLESPNLLLHTDHPRTGANENVIAVPLTLNETVTSEARLTAWLTWFLHHYTGRDTFRICFSQVRSNRREHLFPEVTMTQALSFEDLTESAGKALRDARRHGLTPGKLLEEFGVEDAVPQHPFATVRLVLTDRATDNALTPLCGDTPFDLALVVPHGKPEAAVLCGASSLFQETTVKTMARHLSWLGDKAGAEADAPLAGIALRTEGDRLRWASWNRTERDYPVETCFHHLFAEQALARPGATALIVDDGAGTVTEISYGQLYRDACRVAEELVEWGVQPGDPVGLFVSRSGEMVSGLLGILLAGAAYLPLDPTYPVGRLEWMIDNAGINVVLTREEDEGALPVSNPWLGVILLEGGNGDEGPDSPPEVSCSPDHPAYLIFTSGSTGKPKAIQVGHRGLCNLVYAQGNHFRMRENSRVLQFASFSFDASVSEIAVTLGAGATLVLAHKNKLLPGHGLEDLLQQHAISHVTLPPSVLAYLEDREYPDLTTLVVAGEACSGDLAAKWAGRVHFLNAYGPSENTVCATMAVVPQSGWRGSIGKPMENCRVTIANQRLQDSPMGVPGELCIAGVGLAHGYLGRPALTAQAFVPDPNAATPGVRLYKTGDLARYLDDGQLAFLGRIDHQVKLRGFRIETGEIESVLLEIHDVHQAVVVLHGGDKSYLVAYTGGANPDLEPAIREHLANVLPDYMMPSRFVFMGQLPLTPAGKVDLRALPEPETAAEKREPETETQRQLARIWADVLEINEPGIDDNFFELGGHSLSATQVFTQVNKYFDLDLNVAAVFDHPTIAALAAMIDDRQPATQDQAAPIVRVDRNQDLPLSYAQQRLWFLDRFETSGENHSGSVYHNIAPVIQLTGPLDLPVLEQAVEALLARHESLRTLFPEKNGKPVQAIQPVTPIYIPVVDLAGLASEDREAVRQKSISREARHRFDLARGPLLRLRLLRYGSREHILLITIHHIICDGWSFSIMIREITHLYETLLLESPLQPVESTVQYADFAYWQRQMLQNQTYLTDYWREHLAGIPETPLLPTDSSRPEVMRFRSEREWFTFDTELIASLQQVARQSGVSQFMVFHALFSILLSRFCKSNDIIMGTNIANRNYKEIESVIGFFVNTSVLRCDLSGDPSFLDLLERVRRVNLDLYAYQDMPFDQLVELLQPERSLSYTPLFQVMFVFQNFPMEDLNLHGLQLKVLEEERMPTGYDIGLSLVPKNDVVEAVLEYNTDLFHTATITGLVKRFLNLAEICASTPERLLSEISLVDEEETGGFSSETIADVALSQNDFENLLLAIDKVELPG